MAKKEQKKTPHNLPPKKTLKVVQSKTHPTLYTVVYHEGGTVPSDIDLDFNSRKLAVKALEVHNSYREEHKSYLEHVRDKEYAKIEDEARV